MNDHRKGGMAMIAGAIVGVIVMAVHPQGQALKTSDLIFVFNGIVHTVAIVAMPVIFVGVLALTHVLTKTGRLAILAIAVYGLALVAGVCAAAISGFVTPNIIRRISESGAADAQFWSNAGRLSWWMNQAFARILATNSAIAIMLWSIAMKRQTSFSRAISVYGIVAGVLVAVAVGSGHVRLDVHGFGAITLLETIWLVATGRALIARAYGIAARAVGARPISDGVEAPVELGKRECKTGSSSTARVQGGKTERSPTPPADPAFELLHFAEHGCGLLRRLADTGAVQVISWFVAEGRGRGPETCDLSLRFALSA